MIAAGTLALLAAAPLAGVAVHRWAGFWDRRLAAAAAESQAPPLTLLVGIAAGIAAIAALTHEGAFALLGAGLGWSLLALAVVDWRHQLLPDVLTLPLIVAGLIVAAVLEQGVPAPELVGAALGFLSFAACRWLYWRLRGREGLGLGDAKLLAAAGAWLGWEGLPPVVLVASLTALLFALPAAIGSGRRAGAEIAFGPHLAVAIWALWLYGPGGFF